MPYISTEDAELISSELRRTMESRKAWYDRIEEMAKERLTGEELDSYLAALGDTRTKCVKYYSAMVDVLRHGSGWILFSKTKPKPYERCLFISESLVFEGAMTESGTVSRNGVDNYETVLGEKIISWIPISNLA